MILSLNLAYQEAKEMSLTQRSTTTYVTDFSMSKSCSETWKRNIWVCCSTDNNKVNHRIIVCFVGKIANNTFQNKVNHILNFVLKSLLKVFNSNVFYWPYFFSLSSLIRQSVILLIMYVETFKSDIVFKSNIIMCLTSHWPAISVS